MSEFPRKCPKCRERQLVLVMERYEASLEHDSREYKVSIPDLMLLACSACGNRILPDEADDQVSAELRRLAVLLTPAEIQENRKRLGLTQKQMSLHLDIAEEMLSRLETGAQIQQRAFDKLLRGYFESPWMRAYYSCGRTSDTFGARATKENQTSKDTRIDLSLPIGRSEQELTDLSTAPSGN